MRQLNAARAIWIIISLTIVTFAGCVDSRCYENRDCRSPKICGPSGACVYECSSSKECGSGFKCVNHRCKAKSTGPISCPKGMVAVSNAFCIDRYEASRPDATDSSSGSDTSKAMSVAGVLPWQVADNETAAGACEASGKRLCTPREWTIACKGPDTTVYAYGNTYNPSTCNGIDTFGRDGYHLVPTGSSDRCTNEWGVFDINGNLWEHVAGGDDTTVRGGAYNCLDSAALHRCDYIPGSWTPSARGFRCCLTPADGGQVDGNVAFDAGLDAADATDAGGSCVDDIDTGIPVGVPTGSDAPPVDSSSHPEDANMSEGGDSTSQDSGASISDSALTSDSGQPNRNGLDSGGDAADGSPLISDSGSVDAASPSSCPTEMVPVGAVCMDRYEASRPNATATSVGTDESRAVSQPGVLPWYVNPMSQAALATFSAACQAAGKRLCSASEWLQSCQGPSGSTYFFGNTWDPSACNSVDTYCQECCDILGTSPCPTGENCGYDSALSTSPYTPETCFISADYGLSTCHVCFHVMPTGAFSRCTNALGLYDVNGNVWEAVPVPTTEDSRGYQVRGGAFNCGSPSARFQCTFNATWTALYAGFRCCNELTP